MPGERALSLKTVSWRVVPRQYIPAVEKGVVEAMEEGNPAGYPLVDLKIALYDGSYHTVDSPSWLLKLPHPWPLRTAIDEANPVLLEPIMDVEVTVPDNFMGDIMGDFNSRRGRIEEWCPAKECRRSRPGTLAEMFSYAIDLRSMTQGRGFFS